FLADLGFYTWHRLAHRIPLLWRFHSIHHSVEELDWLAAFRFHPLDQIAAQTFMMLFINILGFNAQARFIFGINDLVDLFAYGNLGFHFGRLRWIFITPEFHHWHHSSERAAYDKNFAGRFPIIDLIFGTFYLPDIRSPKKFGILEPVPLD